MSIKENILKMPAWKAVVCAFLLMFSVGVVVEEILIHTVFHFFDRMLDQMENDKKEDIADMDDMDKREQNDFCEKYKMVMAQKTDLVKRRSRESGVDVDYSMLEDDERLINIAIAYHQFNLNQCLKTLKGKTA